MNADGLLQLYEEISDASDAIARLRDVVLEVGVRGKLNEQDDAETVSPEFLNETSDPEFPANWRTLNFGKYCNIEGGNQPPKSQFVDTPRDGYVRLFQIRDLGERPVPVFIPETSTKRFSVEGEILIGRYGASVGKVFWAQNGAYNVALAKFIFPENAFLPDFAFRLLKSSFFQKALEGASRTAQAGFNKGDLAHIDFPLPPLAEQRRIVAKVDELMALCDQLEQARAGREAVRDRLTTASLARLTAPDTDAEAFPSHARFALQSLPTLTTRPDQIKTLRQTILNLAVRGKLVEQDPTDEPAVELLKRKFALPNGFLRRRKIIKEASVDASQGLLSELPETWTYARIQDLYDANIVVDYADGNHGSLYPRSSEFGEEGIIFVSAKDLVGGKVNWATCSKLNRERASQLTKGWAQTGDVLLTHNATVGRVAIVADEVEPFLLGTSVTFYRLNDQALSPDYFFVALQSPVWQGQLEAIMAQTTRNQVSIQKQAFFQIPLPPLAEQHRIVAKVDDLMALCDQLEASLTTTATTRNKLLNALLHEALEPAAAAVTSAA